MGNSKDRRERNQDMIREARSNPCTDCGITLPPSMMSFYRVGEKGFEIGLGSAGGGSTNTKSPTQLAEELAKCILVCPRCHLERLEGKEVDPGVMLMLRHNINEMNTYLRATRTIN